MSVPTLRHDDSLSSDDNPEHHTPVTPASASDATPIHRRTSSGATVGSLFRRLSALSARISLTAPRHPRGLVWAETRVLPEKCIALEIQARKDLVALSLDDDDANPDSPASFAFCPDCGTKQHAAYSDGRDKEPPPRPPPPPRTEPAADDWTCGKCKEFCSPSFFFCPSCGAAGA